jgi:uncharacterized oxidoreductase
MQIQDKIILITGGSAGIGLEMAKQLVKLGAKVIICGRNETTLKSAAEQFGLHYIRCDVSIAYDQKLMLKALQSKYDRLDMLINNAGMMHKYSFANDANTLTKVVEEIQVNAISPLSTTYHLLPMLKKSHDAAVVFVSSGLAYVPSPATPIYSGTKAFIHHCAQTLRYQFKEHTIKVFELLPPATKTAMAVNFDTPKIPLMSTEKLVQEFIKGLAKDRFEIVPGSSQQVRLMSRIAPDFLFKHIAKSFT